MVTLDPPSYVCPECGNDVTEMAQVLAVGGTVPVTSYGFAARARTRQKRKAFKVMLTCLGTNGTGEPHDVVCIGYIIP
jgi:hypothetical protein